MARKSRKGLVESEVREEQKIYNTAVYVRLSVENSGKADDGISFENQKQICLDYIKGHPDLNPRNLLQFLPQEPRCLIFLKGELSHSVPKFVFL